MTTELTTGIYDNISHADYLQLPYISNSYLGRLAKCPAAAKVKYEETAAMAFGTAVHCYILEGEAEFSKRFAITPICDRRTKEGKLMYAECQAKNAGKQLISNEDALKIFDMWESVYQHPFAKSILADGLSEQTVIWRDVDTGLKCKCRPDRIPVNGRGVLVDLKTCADSGITGFCKSVSSFGYSSQAAMYLDGINEATGCNYDAFVFVAVEKEPPYRTEVYTLDDEFIRYGRDRYKDLMKLELDCKKKGSYPNRQSDELITIYKPKYL